MKNIKMTLWENKMIRIIIVGLSDYRKEIKENIADNIEIVAYCDIEEKRKEYTFFDYKPYVEIEKISRLSYDYFIVAYANSNDIRKAIEDLVSFGARKANVIAYANYRTSLCINPISVFAKTDIDFDVLLFGMSHSQCSIQTQLFNERIYKFASPSMDMFCHYKILKVLIEKYTHKLETVSTYIFEFPYYIFNFDLSRFKSFVANRLYYFYMLSDYHHFGENDDDKYVIENFESFVKIFDKDSSAIKYSYNKELGNVERGFWNTIKKYYRNIRRIMQICKNREDVWYKNYVNTQKENLEYWEKIKQIIKENNPAAEIRILVCPFDKLFRRIHRKAISEKRDQFYKAIGNDVKVYDDFSLNEKYTFIDHCHLNTSSGLKYCKHVMQNILKM